MTRAVKTRNIYRGFNVEEDEDGFWWWTDPDNYDHGPFATEEGMQNDIDAFKRRQRQEQQS